MSGSLEKKVVVRVPLISRVDCRYESDMVYETRFAECRRREAKPATERTFHIQRLLFVMLYLDTTCRYGDLPSFQD